MTVNKCCKFGFMKWEIEDSELIFNVLITELLKNKQHKNFREILQDI